MRQRTGSNLQELEATHVPQHVRLDRGECSRRSYPAGARQEITMKHIPLAALLLAALAAASLAVVHPVLAAFSNPTPDAKPGSRSGPAHEAT